MRRLKIFLLILISIFVVLSGWFYLAGMSAERTVLSNSYYQDLAAETDLVSTLHQELRDSLPQMALQDITKELEADLTEQEKIFMEIGLQIITDAFLQSFDEAWLEDQLLVVTDDVLAVIKGEQQTFTAVINLRENKEQFREKLINSLETLPAELTEMLDIPTAQTEQMAEQILTEMDLPDQIYLADLIAGNGDKMPRDLKNAVSTVQTTRGTYQYLPYFIFVLMLLLSFLLAGYAGGLKWFGGAVVFFSITFLVGIQFSNTLILPVVFSEIKNELPFSPQLFYSAADYTVSSVLIIPLFTAAVGLIFIFSGIILGRANQKAQAE